MKPIKLFIVVVLVNFLAASLAMAGKDILPSQEPDSSPINMSEPPFWMSSYDAFKDLRESQKDYYLEKVLPLITQIPSLNKKTKKDLDEAREWYQSWDQIRKKVYIYCQDKSVEKTCNEIADVRLKTFDLFARTPASDPPEEEHSSEDSEE
ncbi:hypothetical protein [Bdellovibrio sp. HCB337]|uniref:hypothetical protein n=1 Tax=Bdellovibrio sp. HCB337 TaxID=3394358 RepID=UPI0039A75250